MKPVSVTCKNCHKSTEGDYCQYCGQSTKVHRITLYSLISEFIRELMDLEKGYLYTAFVLFKYPGRAIREYLAGKRKMHYSPLKYLALNAALGAFIGMKTHTFEAIAPNFSKILQSPSMIELISKYFNLYLILYVPVMTITTYAFFWRPRFNFAEHVVINTYIVGQKSLCFLLLTPLYLLVPQASIFYIQVVFLVCITLYQFKVYFDLLDYSFPKKFFLDLAICIWLSAIPAILPESWAAGLLKIIHLF